MSIQRKKVWKHILPIALFVAGMIACIFTLASCSFELGKSAYDLYREAYIEANGTEDGILSESEWLASLKGDTGETGETGEAGKDGVGIADVKIVCGDMTIYYDNETSTTLTNAYPDAGHDWNEGEVTTPPTCITSGIKTFTCKNCGKEKKEPIDSAENEHRFGNYSYDESSHWRTCVLCGYTERQNHDFGTVSPESDAETKLECKCLLSATVGELYSYKVTFICGEGVSVKIYNTQDYTQESVSSATAYARDSKTGLLTNDGTGQVNFEVVLSLGYTLRSISISPETAYNKLKGEEDTESESIYRITKITGDLTVTVETDYEKNELPVMVIDTANSAPITDRVNYVTCNVSVLNAEEKYCFSETSAGIRGRGNSTWVLPKKPYKLKFDKKMDLFGNGAAKKWTLLANYGDQSMVRDYLAYSVAEQLDDIGEYSSSSLFVDLYLNGVYQGVYLLCEQVEVGKNRVDIEDDINSFSPEEIGYLLELDARASGSGTEDQDYIIADGCTFAIQSPDYGDIQSEEIDYSKYVAYIKQYMEDVFVALKSEDYAEVLKYMDVNSFADSYIVHELFNMSDVGYASFFVYKKEKGLLYSGPVWDFDLSSGNYSVGHISNNPEFLWAKETNPIYKYLLNYKEFEQLVATKLSKYKDLINKTINDKLTVYYTYKDSIDNNFKVWNNLGEETWQEKVEYVRTWLTESLNYLLTVYTVDTNDNSDTQSNEEQS